MTAVPIPTFADSTWPSSERRQLPHTIWRVTFQQGYGWPVCTHRTIKRRTFTRAEDVSRFVATLAALPNHHRLIGIWTTTVHDWEPCSIGDLPDLPDTDDEGAPHDDPA